MDSMSPRYQENQKTQNNELQKQPQTPKFITRSEPNSPYPTTFVQADTFSFKQVVQMLTGSSETAKQASSKPINPTHKIPPIKSIPTKHHHYHHQQQHQSGTGFKLYERRNSFKKLININPLLPVLSPNNTGLSTRKPEILSPSILDFPALVLSPVTPLISDPFNRSDPSAEDKAIKEKGFFLHPPSPASTPRDAEPRLLPLFPTTSPRASGPSSAS